MERFEQSPEVNLEYTPVPRSYTPEEIGGRLTNEELQELNALVQELFPMEPGDVTFDNDTRFDRWLELDKKAQGLTD